MNSSRRKFIKTGIVATAFATFPLKSVLAEIRAEIRPAPSSDNLERLGYYIKSSFTPYVNSNFLVHLGPSSTRELKLIEVSDYLSTVSSMAVAPKMAGLVCFSLLFTLPAGEPFEQSTYLIGHEALGNFYLFVVPVSGGSKKSQDYYEAIIYRRPQYTMWTDEATGGTVTQPTVNVVPPVRPERNQQRVAGVAPLVILPGGESARPDAKQEQDIYRFRPEKTAPPAEAEQATIPVAPKRIIHPLTLAQAPGINGLKLGMTTEQVLALFPGSKTDEELRAELSRPPSRFGVSSFKLVPAKYTSEAKFSRISQIIFTLLDGRVSTLYVGYDGPTWEHVDEFVAKFAKKRNLPAADNWEAYVGMDTQLKTLKCKEFEIDLFAGGQNLNLNYAQVRDLVALAKFKERRAREKKKKS